MKQKINEILDLLYNLEDYTQYEIKEISMAIDLLQNIMIKEEYEKKTGLLKNSDGSLIYKTENNTYSLLEGFTNNNLKSDILFIYKEPTFKENDAIPGEIVNFMYGGFSEENLKEIKNIIEKYEKENQ